MGQSSSGRPRDRDIDDRVLAAVAAVLDTSGYGAVAVEDVARRAGVSKTAVYRRWPDRSRLVLDALRMRMAGLVDVDTGCTLCDLHEVLTMTTGVFCALGPGTLAQLLAEAARDPGLRTDLLRSVVGPVQSSVRHTLDLAAGRGDLDPEADLDLNTETLCALTFHRLLLEQQPLNERQLEHVVTGVLGGIARDPSRLLAQYRARGNRHPDHLGRDPDPQSAATGDIDP